MVYKHISLFHVITEEAVQTEVIHSQADKLNLDTFAHGVSRLFTHAHQFFLA